MSYLFLLFKSLNQYGPHEFIDNKIKEGVIEYIDVEESSTCLIAMNNKTLKKAYSNNVKWLKNKPSNWVGSSLF